MVSASSESISPALEVLNKFSVGMPCRGAEPKQLAFSAALGITIGIFPICGKAALISSRTTENVIHPIHLSSFL